MSGIQLLRETSPTPGMGPAVLPQHFDVDEATMIKTGKKNPLPVLIYGPDGNPISSSDPLPVSLTGSNTKQVTLANAVSGTGAQQAQPVGGFKTLTIEVYGTATSFTVQIQGIGKSGTPYPLTAVNLSGLTTTQSISTAGLYQIDVTGLASVQANITAVSGGNLTVAGELVAQ